MNMPISRPRLLLPLLLLLFGMSCLLALGGAVPSSRSLSNQEQLIKNEAPERGVTDQNTNDVGGRSSAADEERHLSFVRGRLDLQALDDYPGSGANDRHDPKNPGRP